MRYGTPSQRWVRWFAWRPVKMIDGTLCWLEWVERTSYYNYEIPPSTPFNCFGNFCCRNPTGGE